MKNIYILLTDKPSRLHLWFDKLELSKEFLEVKRNKQNIYITNDEEIKEGYYFDLDINKVLKYPIGCYNKGNKKIILTTDGDLIKDGIQAIDDEFLEWFVKNPSCEFVEINKYAYAKPNFGNYKIIIPQEEPKQETTLEEHYLSIPKPLVDVLRMKVDNHPDIDNKETLEEVAENYFNNFTKRKEEFAFIDGAKWQAERMYSEEEVLKAQQSILCNIKDALMNKNYIIEYLNNLKTNKI